VGVDDYMDREAGVVAAATAAAVSPQARELFRRAAVYGIAGVLKAGDVAVAAARGAVRGARDGVAAASNGAGEQPQPAAPSAPLGTSARGGRRQPSSSGTQRRAREPQGSTGDDS